MENERDKLDTLFLHMTDGVVAFNHEGKLIHCNPAATDMLHRSVDSTFTYGDFFDEVCPFHEMLEMQRPNYKEAEITSGDKALELYLAPVSVLVEDGGTGGSVAAPVAQQVFEYLRDHY